MRTTVTAAYVVVLAVEHPERDEWVDDQARSAPPGNLVPINDETYQGVWILPTPERPRVHLFALPEDIDRLFASGLERTSQR
jgi:hypothetical protein